ncbi:MAG: hypothetical protein KAR20_06790 [Candidatus Heimdallarchaeota archaeon]|nr:hypothetical protein [Candidatus Heimdallarchaeota archaeon]
MKKILLNLWPDYEQESEEHQQWAIGNVDHIYKGITLAHHFFYFIPVEYAWYPEDGADHQSKKHQHYPRDGKYHVSPVSSYGAMLK